MNNTLIPQTFWFRLAIPCRRIDTIPQRDIRSRMGELPASNVLPDMQTLEPGETSWTRVGVAWNPRGIGISVRAIGAKPGKPAEVHPDGFANIQIWIDTRDTRNVSRATRFCHRFAARLSLRRGKELAVETSRRAIARAIADPPVNNADISDAVAELTSTGWQFDWFIPADALHGFDPETNRRLGFAYQISDFVRDDQFLTIGREFPVGENPGLWTTLELVD